MNYKILFALCLGFMLLSNAYALDFLNLTAHKAMDNNSAIYIEQAIKNGTGSYLVNDTRKVSNFGSHDYETASNIYFSYEIWANTSAAWDVSPYYLNIKVSNVDFNKSFVYVYKIYKTYTFLDWSSCYLTGQFGIGSCIFIDDIGAGSKLESTGVYSRVINLPMSDISQRLGTYGGIHTGNSPTIDEYVFGYTTSETHITDDVHFSLYSHNLYKLNFVGTQTISTDLRSNTASLNIPFTVTWRGLYNPLDLGIAIIDNVTYQRAMSDGILLASDIPRNTVLAYKTSNITLTSPKLVTYWNNPNMSIYDMKLSGRFTASDFSNNISAGTYYLIVFQKRYLDADSYLITLASRYFTYTPLDSSNMNNVKIYTFDMNNHRLYDNTKADLWLKLYDVNVVDEVSAGRMQVNLQDILLSYVSKSTAAQQILNYSVYQEDSTHSYITVNMKDYTDILNNQITLYYGSKSPITSSQYYTASKQAGLYFTNNGNYTKTGVMSMLGTDKFNISSSVIASGSGAGSNHAKNIYICDISNLKCITHSVICDASPCLTSQVQQVVSNTTNTLFTYTKTSMLTYTELSNSWTNTSTQYLNSMNLGQLAQNSLLVSSENTYPVMTFNGYGLYFSSDTNIWTLTKQADYTQEIATLSETGWVALNEYSFLQNITATASPNEPIKVYIDVNNINYKVYDVSAGNTLNLINVPYSLPQGEYNILIYTDSSDTTPILRSGIVSFSNVTNVTVGGGRVEELTPAQVTNRTTQQLKNNYTSGSVSDAVSNVFNSIFGSWSVTPYIIALLLTLAIVIYTKNMGAAAITFMSSLFVFAALGWITGIVANALIILVGIIMVYIIYITFKTPSA